MHVLTSEKHWYCFAWLQLFHCKSSRQFCFCSAQIFSAFENEEELVLTAWKAAWNNFAIGTEDPMMPFTEE